LIFECRREGISFVDSSFVFLLFRKYTTHEMVVDHILMIFGEYRGNYRAAAQLHYVRFPDVSIQLIERSRRHCDCQD